jgi:DNA-directed RNA polymerase subunit RPC12/RpoP
MTDRPTALLDWSLYVDCPKCGKFNDLAEPDHDTENEIGKHLFTNAWDKLNGWEVKCQHCGHEFTIEKVEY